CVFEALKQLPALRRLYLLIRSAEKPLPVSLMSQLDHFTLGVPQYSDSFNQTLAFLKPSCTVALDTSYMLFDKIVQIFTNSKTEFTLNVTHLQCTRVYDDQYRFI